MITSSILQKYKDENGEYGVSEEGWKVIENIYANCHYQQDGEVRLQHALSVLAEKGFDVNDETVLDAVEAAVLKLHRELEVVA